MPRMPRFSRTSGSRRSLPPWRIVRRWLVVAAIALLALGAAYTFWFRGSSYVAVEEVKITGTEQVPEVDSALRAAVAGNPAVAGIKVDTQFPHTMLIDVRTRIPVGYLASEGVVVAGDGTILDNTGKAPEGIPEIKVDNEDGGLVSGDLVTGDALEISRVLGAAPPELAEAINSAETDKDVGVSVEIGPGLELRFGDSTSADLKWKAAAAVLADPKFEGASYLDLSVPDRPVAGGVSESTPEPETTVDPTATTATDPAAVVDPTAVTTTDPTLTTVP